jgi:small-conductance mechanosensitive channel
MPIADVGIHAAANAASDSHWVRALVFLGVACVFAFVVDQGFQRRIPRVELSQVAGTRVRFVRRVMVAAILILGILLALNEFAGLSRVATSLLASGAIAAAIIGFAARQTLANFVAGIMLAVTQPIRIGDWVTVEDAYGVVEDVRLNYTILRTPSDQRVVIPNERLASGILRNDTLAIDAVGLDVSVWVAPDADVDRALRALEAETGAKVSVAEAAPGGIRLSVGGDRVPPADKGPREAELRATCLRRLHAEGLLPAGS